MYIADRMVEAIGSNDYDVVLAVPSATSRTRRRGYESAGLIAKRCAKQLKIPYANVLGRHGQHTQLGASRKQRLQQLQKDYYVLNERRVLGKKVLLIDDVATTGATLRACSKVLNDAGAKRVEAAVFARD